MHDYTGFLTEVAHNKKRQLKGSLREKIATELVDAHKSASIWRNEEATRLMTVGNNIPPILYNAAKRGFA